MRGVTPAVVFGNVVPGGTGAHEVLADATPIEGAAQMFRAASEGADVAAPLRRAGAAGAFAEIDSMRGVTPAAVFGNVVPGGTGARPCADRHRSGGDGACRRSIPARWCRNRTRPINVNYLSLPRVRYCIRLGLVRATVFHFQG